MGKFIFIMTFFLTYLYANTLQQNYLFTNPTIISSDLNVSCPRAFEILRIPDTKTSYRINSQVILKTFELNGCSLDSGKTRFVTFSKRSESDYTQLQDQIKTFFTTQYPTIIIQSIQIFSHGYIQALPNNVHAVFDKDMFSKNKGTFYIPDINGIRHYFDFTIDASLSVLHTTQKVSRKDIVSLNNCTMKTIPFNTFRSKPLIKLPQTVSRFKASLREDTPVIEHQIEPLPIVLRGSKVSVQVINDTVIVEFIATATQEGALYDIITIEKADNKRVRAKIIGENTVELQ